MPANISIFYVVWEFLAIKNDLLEKEVKFTL